MKIPALRNLSTVLASLAIVPAVATIVQAQQGSENILIAQRAIPETQEFKGDQPPSIANAGLLNSASDHYFDVLVNGEPLNRLQVNCVTFHELENVKVVNPATDEAIPHEINYGFEEFTVTFDEAIPIGEEIRIVMEGSNVQGVTTGIIVPYRVFGESDALGTIPLGTALVRGMNES